MARLRRRRWRTALGYVAAALSVVFSAWLLLAVFSAVPTPEIKVLQQSGIRLLAEITVVNLLVAAIAFWDEPLS